MITLVKFILRSTMGKTKTATFMVYTYIMILFPNPPKPTLVSMCSVGVWERPVMIYSLLNLRYCSGLASVVFRRPSSIVSRPSSVNIFFSRTTGQFCYYPPMKRAWPFNMKKLNKSLRGPSI